MYRPTLTLNNFMFKFIFSLFTKGINKTISKQSCNIIFLHLCMEVVEKLLFKISFVKIYSFFFCFAENCKMSTELRP